MNNPQGRSGNMRQNRRARGRSGGRKAPNPLTRSYESNGPDVKVRGTASNVAEKYQQLARDALASGDPIAAENYYQHAEHYLRIIASAQPQQNAPAEDRSGDSADDRNERSEEARADNNRQDRGRGRNGASEGNGRDRSEDAGSAASESDSEPASPEMAAMPAFLRNGPSPVTGGENADDANGTAPENMPADSAASGDEADSKPRRAPRRRAAAKPAAEDGGTADGKASPDA